MLVGDTHDAFVGPAPLLAGPPDLNLNHLGCVLVDLRVLETSEKFTHNQRALVLHQVLLDTVFLILARLVHQAQHRVDAQVERGRHVVVFRHLEEFKFVIHLRVKVDLGEVLV